MTLKQFSEIDVARAYKRPIAGNAMGQFLCLLLASTILDGGFIFATAGIAVFAYWAAVVIVVVRHPASPTKGDLGWVRVGFVVSLVLAFIIGPFAVGMRSRF